MNPAKLRGSNRRIAFSLAALLAAIAALSTIGAIANAADAIPTAAENGAASPERGYHLLLNKAYMPGEFNDEVFDALWKTWEPEARERASHATPEERRKMTFERYGLDAAADRPGKAPMQYVVNSHGTWSTNCLTCHGGKVAGQVIPGLPNTHIAMQTLSDEVRMTKLWQGKLGAGDVAASTFPMGETVGTTNAVMFGVALGALRDPELNVRLGGPSPKYVHHDMDAPPWWNVKKKTHLYADGFAPKGHRALMQFMMVPENGPAEFQASEDDYRHLLAWIESLEAPKYPWKIDRELAATGEVAFNKTCSRCHGTYGANEEYPNLIVSLDEVGTDPVRLGALTPEQRLWYQRSWFGHFGEKKVVAEPEGYVAPPLDGIWASAPYLHNGSVPTLWHLMHADERPAVWTRTADGYDQERVGVEATAMTAVPAEVTDPRAKRHYFDTSGFGKSSAGHRFPEELSEAERRAVLEYLKTL